MKKIVFGLGVMLITGLLAFANPISTCIEGGGIYVPDKGCLIGGRAYCGGEVIISLREDTTTIDTKANSNTTASSASVSYEYGWVGDEIPAFAKGYVEVGDYEVDGIQFNAKVDASCKPMEDELIIKRDTLLLLAQEKFYKDGFFIHYGPEPFDWAYIKNDGKLIAFLKPSEGGFLEYAVVDLNVNPLITIKIAGDIVYFQKNDNEE